jgi:PAS domain S-box-containing protein
MTTTLRTLIVEDSEHDTALILRELQRGGYGTLHERVDTPEAMNAALDGGVWDVVLCDHSMPRFSAPEALDMLRERRLDLPFIVISGGISETIVAALVKDGASDFIPKDRLSALSSAIERAKREAALRLERKRAEDALRDSEERFALAVCGSRDGLWDWNITTGHYYCSPRFKEMLGFEEHELEETLEGVMALVHDEDLEQVQRAMADHIERRVPYDVELRMRTKQGELRWFCARGQALWNDAGRPTRMAGSLSDLTARKRAEAVLKEKLELIETQQEAIRALSMPLIEVWDGVLTVPVLGALDVRRAAEMMEALLGAVTRTGSRYVILDLTGVATMDAGTADHVIKLVGAVELLGARGVVVGIQPQVARAIVSLGVDLSRITTLANLRDGLVMCMRQLSGPRATPLGVAADLWPGR